MLKGNTVEPVHYGHPQRGDLVVLVELYNRNVITQNKLKELESKAKCGQWNPYKDAM